MKTLIVFLIAAAAIATGLFLMDVSTLLIFILLYMFVNIYIGYWASSKVNSSSDFIQAGRNLPMFFNATALFALWFGSETVFGASSEFLENGLLGVIEDPFGGCLALILFATFFVRKLYRLNILTLNDLLRDKYGKAVELISGFFMILSFFGYIAAQFVALAIIMNAVTGLDFISGVILCSVLVTLYTFIGGMWAVTITDFVQSIMILIGLIVLAIYLTMQTRQGVSGVIESAPEGTFRFFPDSDAQSITDWISAWMVLGLGSLCSQDIFQRANSAKNETAAVRSTYLGGIMYLIVAMLPLYIALTARYLYPQEDFSDTQAVLPSIVLAKTPLIIQILFFGSLLSAILSTCSGAILAPASILSENIIKPLSGAKWSDKKFLFILRLSVVIMAAISTAMACMRGNIYELVGESSILGMVSLLVPLTAALYWPRASSIGAMFAMFLGMISWIIFERFFAVGVEAFLPALLFSILGQIFGSILFPDHKMITNKPEAYDKQ